MAGTFSAVQALDVWDSGQRLDDVGRALALLAAAGPTGDRDVLARLPVGTRDGRLLKLRAALFGDRAPATIACVGCGETLEFEFAVGEMVAAAHCDGAEAASAEGDDFEVVVELANRIVRCGLPDSVALRAVAATSETGDGTRALLHACVIAIDPDGSIDDLDDEEIAAIERRIVEVDPGADLTFTVEHASCGTVFEACLAPDRFLWAELDGWAQRTIGEVHELAARYGWSEADILSISPQRRRRYLAVVEA